VVRLAGVSLSTMPLLIEIPRFRRSLLAVPYGDFTLLGFSVFPVPNSR